MLVRKFRGPFAIRSGIPDNKSNSEPVVSELLKELPSQAGRKIEEVFSQLAFGQQETVGVGAGPERLGDVFKGPDTKARIGSNKDGVIFVHLNVWPIVRWLTPAQAIDHLVSQVAQGEPGSPLDEPRH